MSQQHATPQRSAFPSGPVPGRRRSSDSGLPSEKSRDSGGPRPEPYRPGPLRHGGAGSGGSGGHFGHGRGATDSRSNGMGARGGAFMGRGASGGRREGGADEDFNKLMMCLVGHTVEVQRADGAVFQGIFHTREAEEAREFGKPTGMECCTSLGRVSLQEWHHCCTTGCS
jgi:hypothetical protein